MMTMHVFVGAGPANLHLALKIAKQDPVAQFFFIDKRLRPETNDFDRQKARSNIFLFDSGMAQQLIDDGLSQTEWDALIYKRRFGLEKESPSDNRFYMIQIRDLQQLILNTIVSWFSKKPKKLVLIAEEIDLTEGDEAIPRQVIALLQKHHIQPEGDPLGMTIHVATGALSNDDQTGAIHYPAKSTGSHHAASSDLDAMPIVPKHVTCTFNIHENNITCAQLEKAQQSLAKTDWQTALKRFDWDLVRPPSIRVFYSNDVLYIASEVPAKIMAIKNKGLREQNAILYTQALARLVFPGLPIETLTVNPGSGATFETARGERGQIRSTSVQPQFTPSGHRNINVDLINHGDNRYLPHYQTASGFITAMLQNNLYTDIYRKHHFHDLYLLAKDKGLVSKSEAEILKQYQTFTGQRDEKLIVQAFQAELLNAGSRDIIEANKEKVGFYFNGLHRQELTALAKNLPQLIQMYNAHQKTTLKESYFNGVEPAAVVIGLLHVDNMAFLREIMPSILNQDFTQVSDAELLNLRNVHVQDYERALIENKTVAHGSALAQNIISLSSRKPEDLARIMGQLARSLDQNKTLQHRAAFSFFKGRHTDSVHQFAKKIDELRHNMGPTTKNDLIDTLVQFHSKLEADHSIRTMQALEVEIDTIAHQNTKQLI